MMKQFQLPTLFVPLYPHASFCMSSNDTIPAVRTAARTVAGLCLAFLLWVGATPHAQAQSTFTVDTAGDASDASVGDGVCATAAGDCTFRAALNEANADADLDVIEFSSALPVNADGRAVINVASELRINAPVEIRGRTAPGYTEGGGPVVVLASATTDAGVDGLEIAAQSVIEALSIVGFPDDGIDIRAGDGTRVSFCYIGLEPDGSTENENSDSGIEVQASDVSIGYDADGNGGGNVISSNSGSGIFLNGADPQVRVGGNIIGLDATGSLDRGNSGSGVLIPSGSGSDVGFTVTDGTTYGNVISGNASVGILLQSDGHSVVGNTIGLSQDESTAIPNSIGLFLEVSNNTIGPPTMGEASNVIAGNNQEGVRVGRAAQTSANNNLIQGNYIGTASSSGVFPNTDGIQIEFGSDNTISGNVIGGNNLGIRIAGSSARNVVTGNRVGVRMSGDNVGNAAGGIQVSASFTEATDANVIGGATLSDANIVGFNSGYGISVEGARNDVLSNYVGTDAGANDLGNDGPGIRVLAPEVEVGRAGSGSVVGYNDGGGILVQNAANVTVRGNYVGATPGGDVVGNINGGIEVVATSGNATTGTILGYGYGESIAGDARPEAGGAGNRVANNGGAGITISGSGNATGNAVRGNAVFANAGGGIDLGGDGPTANDGQDADPGANNLQNFPTFSDLETEVLPSGDVQVRFLVDSDPANSDYGTDGLRIDFYRAESDVSAQGDAYLGTALYDAADAGQFVTTTFTPPSSVSIERADQLVGIATDASGNSSEFTADTDPLPVELAFFRSTRAGEATALLEWTTLTEDNNAGFYVEQKVDGSFQTASPRIASKAENGTSTEELSYRYRVEDLDLGTTHTFRLRQVDVDGAPSYSDEVTVKLGIQDAYDLRTYPNPVRSNAKVDFAVSERQPVTIGLYNTLGQRVRTVYNGTPQVTGEYVTVDLDASGLASGVYFVRMRGAQGFATTQKLVVVR